MLRRSIRIATFDYRELSTGRRGALQAGVRPFIANRRDKYGDYCSPCLSGTTEMMQYSPSGATSNPSLPEYDRRMDDTDGWTIPPESCCENKEYYHGRVDHQHLDLVQSNLRKLQQARASSEPGHEAACADMLRPAMADVCVQCAPRMAAS